MLPTFPEDQSKYTTYKLFVTNKACTNIEEEFSWRNTQYMMTALREYIYVYVDTHLPKENWILKTNIVFFESIL